MIFRKRFVTFLTYSHEGAPIHQARFRSWEKALAEVKSQWTCFGFMLRDREYEEHMFPSRRGRAVKEAREFVASATMAIHDRETGTTRFYKSGFDTPYRTQYRSSRA